MVSNVVGKRRSWEWLWMVRLKSDDLVSLFSKNEIGVQVMLPKRLDCRRYNIDSKANEQAEAEQEVESSFILKYGRVAQSKRSGKRYFGLANGKSWSSQPFEPGLADRREEARQSCFKNTFARGENFWIDIRSANLERVCMICYLRYQARSQQLHGDDSVRKKSTCKTEYNV